MKIYIFNILISLLFLTACNNTVTNEKIQLGGSDISLDLTVEDIVAEVNEYAFELPAERYRAKKFKGGYDLTIKYKIKNISDQELIFSHYDYINNNLYLISGPTSIEKLIYHDVGKGNGVVDDMLKNGEFMEGYQGEKFKEFALYKDESRTFEVNYNTIDSNLKELYFGGFLTKPNGNDIHRLFFKIEQEKSFMGKIKYIIAEKKFEKITEPFYNVDIIN